MSRLTRWFSPPAAVIMLCGTVSAQPPRMQDMPFGGGSHFEFLIPVQAKGRIFAQVTWATNVALTAELYSPKRANPVAVTSGTGMLRVSHEVTSWRAGDQWLLKLTAEQDAPDLRGDLHVVWPAGLWPLNVVQWQNGGPSDPAMRLALREGIDRLLNDLSTSTAPQTIASGNPVLRADLRKMATTVATRLAVLEEIPDRYLANDETIGAGSVRIDELALRRQTSLSARVLQLACLHQKPWHARGESDQPVVIAAFLSPGTPPTVNPTPSFDAVRSGDAPIASAGGQLVLRSTAPGTTHLALALFEDERGSTEETVARLKSALQLYQAFSDMNGGHDPAAFAWLVTMTAETSDDIIGTPRLIAIQSGPDSVSPTANISFTGHGAQYSLAVQVVSR